MKGIIFNLLEEVVSTHLGEAAWDGFLESVGVDGAYTSLGNYPDEEFSRLVGAMSRQSGKSDRETLKWFGQLSMPFLAQRYPEFFTPHKGLRSFLLSLNDVIHAEVRKLYPGAEVPVFEFEMSAGAGAHDTLIIHYRSKRRLCSLAEGFIAGAADHFDEVVTVTQPNCMLEDAPACALVCRFESRA
ncbi:MAG: heme NO-binding domain-containing protein [Steroidobacteraceae bacterium]